ncbi:unnamed protein product [Effrenium voratum]|nr:unnamed protein product [Effrenium voratum]
MSTAEKIRLWNRTQDVKKFDVFFSHSWATSGRLKYAALLIDSGFGYSFLFWIAAELLAASLYLFDFLPMPHLLHVEIAQFSGDFPLGMWMMAFGALAQFIGLILSPYLPSKRRDCFVDFASINQFEPELMHRGILGLGDCLSLSTELCILWSPKVFTRLWCVFELAAFRTANPSGRLRLLPLYMTVEIGITMISAVLGSLLVWISGPVMLSLEPTSGQGGEAVKLAGFLVLMWCFVSVLRRISLQKRSFIEQLDSFDLDNAESRMETDKELIYEAITRCYGSLEQFTEYVRNDLRKELLESSVWIPLSCPLSLAMPCAALRAEYLVALWKGGAPVDILGAVAASSVAFSVWLGDADTLDACTWAAMSSFLKAFRCDCVVYWPETRRLFSSDSIASVDAVNAKALHAFEAGISVQSWQLVVNVPCLQLLGAKTSLYRGLQSQVYGWSGRYFLPYWLADRLRALALDTDIREELPAEPEESESPEMPRHLWRKPPCDMSTAEKVRVWNMTQDVKKFDVFFSHSWATSGRLKYAALLIDTGFGYSVLFWIAAELLAASLYLFDFLPMPHLLHVEIAQFSGDFPLGMWMMAFGALAQFIGLILSPYLPSKRRDCFVDFASINQFEPELMHRGILGLGDCLSLSTELCILWCVFELAAFRAANPSGRLRLLPLHMIVEIGITMISAVLGSLAVWISGPTRFTLEPTSVSEAARWAAVLALTWCFVSVLRRISLQKRTFIEQLDSFDLDNAESRMERDKELIYEAITRCYGSLEQFTEYVRSDLRKDLLENRAWIPLSCPLSLVMPFAALRAEHVVALWKGGAPVDMLGAYAASSVAFTFWLGLCIYSIFYLTEVVRKPVRAGLFWNSLQSFVISGLVVALIAAGTFLEYSARNGDQVALVAWILVLVVGLLSSLTRLRR